MLILPAVLVMIVGLLAIAGCASSDTMVMEPLPPNHEAYSTFAFSVVPHVAEDIADEQADLIDRVVSQAGKLNIFREVVADAPRDPSPGTLFCKATVTQVHKVNNAAHFFLGVFAGNASVTCDLVFIDGGDGRVVGSYHIVGESGGSGFSGGTDDAVSKLSQAIVKILKDSYVPKRTTHKPAW